MPVRALAALPCVGLLFGARALAQAPTPTQSPQELFRDVLLKDPNTTSGVKRLLRTNAGFVSPTPVFADLTGDGKSDAVVTVENGGAAGAVAAYVLTAEGSASGALRVAFRNQSLYRGRVRDERPDGDRRPARSTRAATTSAARARRPSATTRGTPPRRPSRGARRGR